MRFVQLANVTFKDLKKEDRRVLVDLDDITEIDRAAYDISNLQNTLSRDNTSNYISSTADLPQTFSTQCRSCEDIGPVLSSSQNGNSTETYLLNLG
jgi:hypothetical protein